MEAYVDTLCLLSQPKEGQQFKNKKQPEMTENRTVWKSDNQGDKEDTFIQTDRRGGAGQPVREDLWGVAGGQGPARLQLAGKEQLAEAAAAGPGSSTFTCE